MWLQGQKKKSKENQSVQNEVISGELDEKLQWKNWWHCKLRKADRSNGMLKSYSRGRKKNNDKSHNMMDNTQTSNEKKGIGHLDTVVFPFDMDNVYKFTDPHKIWCARGRIPKSKRTGIFFISTTWSVRSTRRKVHKNATTISKLGQLQISFDG